MATTAKKTPKKTPAKKTPKKTARAVCVCGHPFGPKQCPSCGTAR